MPQLYIKTPRLSVRIVILILPSDSILVMTCIVFVLTIQIERECCLVSWAFLKTNKTSLIEVCLSFQLFAPATWSNLSFQSFAQTTRSNSSQCSNFIFKSNFQHFMLYYFCTSSQQVLWLPAFKSDTDVRGEVIYISSRFYLISIHL